MGVWFVQDQLVSCIVVESQSCSCLQNDGAFSSYKGVTVDVIQLLVSHEKAVRMREKRIR